MIEPSQAQALQPFRFSARLGDGAPEVTLQSA
jgi:hypothetical protein